MRLSQVLRRLSTGHARWLLLAAGVAGLLYGVSTLATWSVTGDAHLTAAGAATQPQPGPWYGAWRATAPPPAAGTPPAEGYTLGDPLGPEPADFLARRVTTLARALVAGASGTTVLATDVLAMSASPDESAAPAEPLLAVQPTSTDTPPTAISPPTQPPASAPALPSNTAGPAASSTPLPAPSNTAAPPIGLPTLPLPTLPLPQPTTTAPPPAVASPTSTPPPTPTDPPVIVLPTLALPTLAVPTLPLPLP